MFKQVLGLKSLRTIYTNNLSHTFKNCWKSHSERACTRSCDTRSHGLLLQQNYRYWNLIMDNRKDVTILELRIRVMYFWCYVCIRSSLLNNTHINTKRFEMVFMCTSSRRVSDSDARLSTNIQDHYFSTYIPKPIMMDFLIYNHSIAIEARNKMVLRNKSYTWPFG